MAIVKVGTYRNPPEDITDYEAIVSHLEAYTRQVGNQGMILTEWTNTTNAPKIAMGSYISHGGVLYVVDTEDYVLPALSSDGTYYIRVAVSGDTLALDYITNLTGYAWNAIYNGLYHPDGKQVLPYQVVRVSSGASITKRKVINLESTPNKLFSVDYLGVTNMGNMAIEGHATIGGTLAVTGAISGASINTGGLGAFLIGQNLRTTDSPTFAGIDTGYGVNEVFKISNETFDTGYVAGNIETTRQISAMNVGEIRFVRMTGTIGSSSSSGFIRLLAPSGGVYICTHGGGAGLAGGQEIFRVYSDSENTTTINAGFVIRRLS